jgi:hypothetical protein
VEAHRHLGAAGVVRAQEEHDGCCVRVGVLDLGQCLEALPGEPLGQQRKEVEDGRPAGELVIRGVQKPVDRFRPER